MSLLVTFVRHEVRTQLRSSRFAGLALAYSILTAAPAFIIFLVARRADYVIEGHAYSGAVDILQPLLTALVAVALCVDGISREREEGSLGVISLAPLSAAGYVFRRWAALLAILLPLTFVPRVIAYAVGAGAMHSFPRIEPFVFGWLTHAVPPAMVISALAIALGTITGRTALAMIGIFFIFTVGLGLVNDVLAYSHRQVDGIGAMIAADPASIDRLWWALRGWGIAGADSSAAGENQRLNLQGALVDSAIPIAIAAPLLGFSTWFLRRSRPDLRPWRIREDHQLRSFLRVINRLREDYRPDAGRQWQDRVAVATGCALAVALVIWIDQRHSWFLARATERYEAEEQENAPTTPLTVSPLEASVRGRIEKNGFVETETSVRVRNDGQEPVGQIVFALNPGLWPRETRASFGAANARKTWERIEIDIRPPLMPGQTRSLTVNTSGVPAVFNFNLQASRSFAHSFRKFRNATSAFDLSDLSRSVMIPKVSAVRAALWGTDLMPVLRYSPWKVGVAEVIGPEVPLTVAIEIPSGMRAADACGTVGARTFKSACRTRLADYRLRANDFESAPLAPSITLAHIPSHRDLARTHGPSLAGGVSLAREAWPAIPIPPELIFYEVPIEPGDDRPYWLRDREIHPAGRLVLVAELEFINTRPIAQGEVAAALLSNALRKQRRVVPEQQQFFAALYDMLGKARVGGRTPNAVIPATGASPDRNPLLKEARGDRLSKVFVDLEYRVGTERLLNGVEDFVFGGPAPGTARELLAAIEKRSGVDLDAMYRDYFESDALPVLTLDDVQFVRDGERWEVRGSVSNQGTGESVVPLVLRTAGGPQRKTMTVGSGQSVPFVFATEHEPRVLQLDPERVCYRFAQIGTTVSVDYKGRG